MDGAGGACQAAARATIHPQDGMLHALLLSARRRGSWSPPTATHRLAVQGTRPPGRRRPFVV